MSPLFPRIAVLVLSLVLSSFLNILVMQWRQQPTSCFKVLIHDWDKEFILYNSRPNPLNLTVRIDQEQNVFLNKELHGTVSNCASLKKRLEILFSEREEWGVYREGSRDIEKTVFLNADKSLKYQDVIKIVDVLKGAGAEPITLEVESFSEYFQKLSEEQKRNLPNF